MKAYACDNCGCEVKGDKPDNCPLCKKRGVEFFEHELPDPDPEEQKSSQKYEEALHIIEEYAEGCEPERAEDAFEE